MSGGDNLPVPVLSTPPGTPMGTTDHPIIRTEQDTDAQAAGAIVMCVWTLLANFILILSILRSEHRRKVSFNLHVCNLALVGVAVAAFILPFYAEQCLRGGEWEHGDRLCQGWIVADLLACTISVLIVLMMIFDRFFLFSCPEAAEGCCKYVLSSMLIILPWGIGCALIIPLYMYGETGMGVQGYYGVCYLDLKKAYAIAIPLAGYAVPAVAAFGLLVATSLTWCVRRQELREMDYSEEREHKGWQVITSWVVAIAVLGMWFPLPALRLLTYLIPEDFPTHWYIVATWLGYASSALTPILWMLMPRLRRSVFAFCCCCCGCCPCSKCCRTEACGYEQRGYDKKEKDDETGAAMIEFHG